MDLYEKLDEIERLKYKLESFQDKILECDAIIDNACSIKLHVSFDQLNDKVIVFGADHIHFNDFIEIFSTMRKEYDKSIKLIEKDLEKFFCKCNSKKTKS